MASHNPPPSLPLGLWLAAARKQKKMAQREIAALAGIDSSHLGKYERGDRIPSMRQAPALAEAYGVPLPVLKQRIIACEVLASCDGDAELAQGALSCVGEEAAAYNVNKPANNMSIPPASDTRSADV